ncbi:MAG: phospholipase D family protein [Kofleriaceae bacterium]
MTDGLVAKRRSRVVAAKRVRAASNDGLVAADSLARVAKSMRTSTRTASERADDAATSLERVASKLRAPKRSAKLRADDAATSLERVARKLRTPRRSAKERADDVYVVEREPFDLHLPARPMNIELVGGRAHYDRVIAAVMQAHTSVWIATANVKGMMVEGAAKPGARRTQKRGTYVSVISRLDELAARGVELRLLHAELPSGPFREELVAHPRLAGGALALARCPRVHMKAVIVDGALLYLGSANWTGAGLGAKGSGKRNFELGVITDDAQLLDQVQALFDRVWSGAECARCKLRDVCPGPLDSGPGEPAPIRPRAKRSRQVARSPKRV